MIKIHIYGDFENFEDPGLLKISLKIRIFRVFDAFCCYPGFRGQLGTLCMHKQPHVLNIFEKIFLIYPKIKSFILVLEDEKTYKLIAVYTQFSP